MGLPPDSRTTRTDSADGRPGLVGSDARSIDRASAVLEAGGIVAIPTETVYGLAADARSQSAVRKVFRVKGRPADHPLIVHIGSKGHISEWAREVPEDALRLIEAFWPGPLTLVLPRHPSVPLEVTGGRDSVAIRMPAHPVAASLLEVFGGGVAAPSANRFGRVSPTSAADVISELGSAVDLVVDGGPCPIGVESTVVEVRTESADSDTAPGVTILRPGGVSAEDLEEALGGPVSNTATGPARAPGMLASHYAPETPVVLCGASEVAEHVERLASSGKRVGLLAPDGAAGCGAHASWDAGGDFDLFARSLYGWLREADSEALDVLVAVPPEPRGIGAAIRDRLEKAARHRA